jgi:hypothetical protein
MKNLNIKIIQEVKQKMEGFVSKTLNQVRDTIGSNCNKELPPTNGPLIMVFK